LKSTLQLRAGGAPRRYDERDFPLTVGGPEADIEIPGRPDIGPIAYLGIAESEIFLQPVAGGEAVFCNGNPVTTSLWLRHADVLKIAEAELTFSSDGGGAALEIRHQEPDDSTEPPSVVMATAPPPGQGEGVRSQRIRPIDFTPAPLEAGRRRRRAPRLSALALWLVLILLATVAWYLFSSRPVEIRVEPTPEVLQVQGGLVRLQIGGRYLLRPGTYRVVAESPGYRQLSSPIEVTKASTQAFEFKLESLPGLLVVELGVEAAATLWVDGEKQVVWPLEPIELATGEHNLLIQAEGYRDFVTAVAIEGGGAMQTLEVELQPLWAAVILDSQPAGASVRIDGELVGRTPLTTEVLEGDREIEISLAGFKPHRRRLRVEAEETVELQTVRLLPNDGILTLSSVPPGATVTVDGEYRGQTPLEVSMAPGRQYEVNLSKLGYEPQTLELALASGEDRSESVALVERLGEVAIIARPAGAELYVNGELRGSANQTLRLQAVPQQIEIRKQGFVSHAQTVTPRPGVSQALEVTLLTEQEAKSVAIPPVIQGPQGQELRLIEPGRFRMGAPRREPGRRANETLREIEITRAFYMATQEVSNKEFRQFQAKHRSGRGGRVSLENDHHPVVNVSWEDAARYCNWLSEKASLEPAYAFRNGELQGVVPLSNGYRLPTEAEWAWGARFAGGGGFKYPWGSSLPVASGSGNYADLSAQDNLEATLPDYRDGFPGTAPVDSFEPNAVGLKNMGGNVAEWTHDYYAIAPSNSGPPIRDPLGPESGDYHVIRGSSWMHSTVTELRLSFRDYGNKPRPDVGFRIARYAE
jgi:formylglycine-generating enzyme required for sulfatase activity